MDAEETRAALAKGAKGHWAGVAEAIHEAISGKVNASKKEHLTDVLETFEQDLAPHLAPVLGAVMEHPNFPEVLRPLFAEISNPTHLTSSLTVGIAVGAIISPAIGAAFAPFVNELADQVWTQFPTMELSPSEAAAGVLKGVLSRDEAASEAITSGLNGKRFDQLVEIAGQSIGIAEALLLWRRGQITDEHLTEIIRYSNLNPKFYEDVRKLRYAPPGTGSVLSGYVQGHLEEGPAQEKYQAAGGDPDNFQWQYEATGRPPGTEQLLHLLNRKLVTEDFVRSAIRESDIKNKYIDAIIESRVYLPPPRSIVPMLRHGAITEAEARELLTEHGVQAKHIDAFIAEAHSSKATTGKALTEAQVVRMFGEHFITRAEAQTRLVALLLPADEVELLLNFTEEQRRERYLNAAITKTRTLYVGHKIGKPVANGALNELGIPGAAITELFSIWDIERETSAPNLTVAQWQGVLRRGIASHAVFDDAMERFGYTPEESDYLAALAFPPPKAPAASKTRDLTVSQLVKLAQSDQITPAELHARIKAMGYSDAEASEIASIANPPIPGG